MNGEYMTKGMQALVAILIVSVLVLAPVCMYQVFSR